MFGDGEHQGTAMFVSIALFVFGLATAQDLPDDMDMPNVDISMSASPTSAGQTVQIEGEPFIINGIGQKVTHNCTSHAPPDVIINGTGSEVVLTGACGTVTVNGTTLRVSIDSVAHLVVSGMTNQVEWGSGANGKAPEVEEGGGGNVIRQRAGGGNKSAAGGQGAAKAKAKGGKKKKKK